MRKSRARRRKEFGKCEAEKNKLYLRNWDQNLFEIAINLMFNFEDLLQIKVLFQLLHTYEVHQLESLDLKAFSIVAKYFSNFQN